MPLAIKSTCRHHPVKLAVNLNLSRFAQTEIYAPPNFAPATNAIRQLLARAHVLPLADMRYRAPLFVFRVVQLPDNKRGSPFACQIRRIR